MKKKLHSSDKKHSAQQSEVRKTLVGSIHPDVLAFTTGNDPQLDMNLALWDCIGSAAHVTMLAQIKSTPPLIKPEEREQIITELLAVIRRINRGEFVISLADQDIHLAVERALTESLGDLGRRIHTGRSRNDQVAVDIRLHIRDELLGLIDEVAELAGALSLTGKRNADVPMVGRTHLQPAMPSSVGLWATSYAEMLLDDLLIVEAAYSYNDMCPLGSAAGYGVPLPLDRNLTAKLLGFAKPHHNVLYASNTRGKNEALLLAACSQIMLTLSRLAEDLILFVMPEFNYFTLPPELCTGSSIMPQKYNPDVMELIRAKASLLLGYATAVNATLKAMPGGYNRDLQDTKGLYMEGLQITRSSLRIMTLMAKSLQVNKDKLRAGFLPGVFATDQALKLVANGMPFREAYATIRANLDDLSLMDPDEAVKAKTHVGSSGGLDFAMYQMRVREVRQNTSARRRRINRAFTTLLGVDFPVQ